MHKLSIRPLKQYGEILAILITYISSNLKICIYMTDLDFQKHCQIWINVLLVIKQNSKILIKISMLCVSIPIASYF